MTNYQREFKQKWPELNANNLTNAGFWLPKHDSRGNVIGSEYYFDADHPIALAAVDYMKRARCSNSDLGWNAKIRRYCIDKKVVDKIEREIQQKLLVKEPTVANVVDKEDWEIRPPEKSISHVAVETVQTEEECVVCLDAKREIALVPCGHRCICSVCAEKIDKLCPLCKTAVASTIKIFL